jgi:ADP-ribose pyrophosphatase YjhB (NUDIX family)
MPKPVSKRQYRYMMAILHGNKHGSSKRGDRIPESIARKYTEKETKQDDLPESKGKEMEGGLWTAEHHNKHAKKKLKKSDQIQRVGGALVVDESDRILLGINPAGEYELPGGKIEDSESFEQGILRELKEETGLKGKPGSILYNQENNGQHVQLMVVTDWSGDPKPTSEHSENVFVALDQIPWKNMRRSSVVGIETYLSNRLQKCSIKPLKLMIAQGQAAEALIKNIIRTDGPSDTVYDADYGDALKHVKSSTFKFLRDNTKDMTDESVKEIKLGSIYTINIRKHVNDVYSGKVTNGQKVIHHFATKSLPSVALDLMSLFEWYSPEDEQELENMDDYSDEYSAEFLQNITKDYEKNNLGQIYSEIETIRQEIRNEVSVDIVQVEQRIMKLFDRLQELMMDIGVKHNELTEISEKEIEQIQDKLLLLQSKLEEMEKQPVNVDAYVPNPNSQNKVHEEYYPYLPKPQITIHPSGKVTISFGQEWTGLERENFLQDMKAKIIGNKK